MKQIDARGRSCPEPVIMAKKALEQAAEPLTILVDNPAAKENVTRFASHAGFAVTTTESNGDYTLTITR